MILACPLWLRRLLREETAQILPVSAILMVALLGMTGIVVDFGNVYLCHRELQQSSDAAALAGAEVLPTSLTTVAVQATAINYSSLPGAQNTYRNLPNVTMAGGYPFLECVTTLRAQGISCVGPLPYNAVQVRQQAVVPMYFGKLFGKPTMTITTTSTAVKGGASSRPYNVAVLIDTTLSMNFYDGDCGSTQITCALSGFQILMQHLDPCQRGQGTCVVTAGNAANSVVRASLFTLPQVTSSTVNLDSSCSSNPPTATTYTFPAAGAGAYSPSTTTYRVLDFHSDYRVSDTATQLNALSQLTNAAGGVQGCAGMSPPANAGNYGTYYAAAIYAAQSALIQARTANPGSENILIVLSDGDANAPHTNGPYLVMGPGSDNSGLYPSWSGECGQAVDAANFATAQGTTVYTVAYGSPSTGCTTDVNAGTHPNISPCNTMAYMASHAWTFFSDYKQTGSASTCIAAQSMTSLSDIFLQIAGDLTVARLISNDTT